MDSRLAVRSPFIEMVLMVVLLPVARAVAAAAEQVMNLFSALVVASPTLGNLRRFSALPS